MYAEKLTWPPMKLSPPSTFKIEPPKAIFYFQTPTLLPEGAFNETYVGDSKCFRFLKGGVSHNKMKGIMDKEQFKRATVAF